MPWELPYIFIYIIRYEQTRVPGCQMIKLHTPKFSYLDIGSLVQGIDFTVILSRRSRQRERLHAMGMSICLLVCLSFAKMQKRDFLKY